MSDFEKQDGVSFFLIYYTHRDVFYYLKLDHLIPFWNRALEGGRKSFRFEELDDSFILPVRHGIPVPYLDMMKKDLDERNE